LASPMAGFRIPPAGRRPCRSRVCCSLSIHTP
jgi:hypothetical protein